MSDEKNNNTVATPVPAPVPAPQGLPQIPKPNGDLWDALLALVPAGRQHIVEKKLLKAQQPKPEAPVPRAASQWRDDEIILIIHEATCRSCDARFQWPNQHLLMRKSHPTLGSHYVQVDPNTYQDVELQFPNLPQRTEYQLCEVATCQHCFNIANLLSLASKEHN